MIRTAILLLLAIVVGAYYLANAGRTLTAEELSYQIALAVLTGSVLLWLERVVDGIWEWIRPSPEAKLLEEVQELRSTIDDLNGEVRRLRQP